MADAFASLAAALAGGTYRFDRSAVADRFGDLLSRANGHLDDFAQSADATCQKFARLGRNCSKLASAIESGAETVRQLLGPQSQLAAAAAKPAVAAHNLAQPPKPQPANATQGPWERFMAKAKPAAVGLLGLDDGGEKSWVDRGSQRIKFAKGARYVLEHTVRHGLPHRILNSKVTKSGFDIADTGMDVVGDAGNIARGVRDLFDPAKSTWDSIKGIGAGITGFATDVSELWDHLKDFAGAAGHLLAKRFPAWSRFASLGEGAIGPGGVALSATEGALAMGAVEGGGMALEGGMLAMGGTAAAGGGIAAALASNPVGWTIAAVAAIGLATYAIYENWTPIKAFFSGLWQDVAAAFKWAWNNIVPWIPGLNLVKTVVDNWKSIAGFFGPIWSKVAGGFRWTFYFLVGLGDYAAKMFVAVWRPIAGFFTGLWNRVSGIFQWAGSRIGALLTRLGRGAVNLLMSAWLPLKSFFKGLWDYVAGQFSAAWQKIKGVMQSIGDGVKWVLEKTGVMAAAQGIGDWASRQWNGLKSGANAIEHHGEDVAQKWRGPPPPAAPGHPRAQALNQSASAVHMTVANRPQAPAHDGARITVQRPVTRGLPPTASPRSARSAGPALATGALFATGPVYASGPVKIVSSPAVAAPSRQPRSSSDIRVRFENSPPGTRVSTRTAGPVRLQLDPGRHWH